MTKIILIHFVLILFIRLSCQKCEIAYSAGDNVCGTDGKTYLNPSHLLCDQREEHGKRINLQLKHDGACWIWEKHGLETNTVIFVSMRVV